MSVSDLVDKLRKLHGSPDMLNVYLVDRLVSQAADEIELRLEERETHQNAIGMLAEERDALRAEVAALRAVADAANRLVRHEFDTDDLQVANAICVAAKPLISALAALEPAKPGCEQFPPAAVAAPLETK